MATTLDLHNIQGDVLSGLPKKTQTYLFFQITDTSKFRTQLANLIPLIKTTAQVLQDRDAINENKRKTPYGENPPLIPMSAINIAFSHAGLVHLGITDDLKDASFTGGQLADAKTLGDSGTIHGSTFVPDWDPAFKKSIHGLILISGDSHSSVNAELFKVAYIFGLGSLHPSIHEVFRAIGDVRPGAEAGHEHFGYLDGISNPAVKGFDANPNPGQETVRQGIILLGRDGDAKAASRPPWTLDGSFLAFRYLLQRVPEFNSFLLRNAITDQDQTPEEGADLLGARLIGRWKSGAPIDLAPFKDDPALGSDPLRNNNFRFQGESADSIRCPFAAHIRKTNPRADLEDLTPPVSTETRRIIRRGIQFGPEVTAHEARHGTTYHHRGLLFACYQSSIDNGFHFVQTTWANNAEFPPNKIAGVTPGLDPIIGQAGGERVARVLEGTTPDSPTSSLVLPAEFVVSRGGEYFFVPSIAALRDTLAEGDACL